MKTEPKPIALAKTTRPDHLPRWRALWLQMEGPRKDIPLAAFIREPSLLIAGIQKHEKGALVTAAD